MAGRNGLFLFAVSVLPLRVQNFLRDYLDHRALKEARSYLRETQVAPNRSVTRLRQACNRNGYTLRYENSSKPLRFGEVNTLPFFWKGKRKKQKEKTKERKKKRKKTKRNRKKNWAASQVIIAIANFHLRAIAARRVKCSAGTRKDSRIMSFAKAL